MIVRTVQTLEAYKQMRVNGYIIGHRKYVYDGLNEPYLWMMEKMKKRLPNYDGSTYSIWIWKRYVNRNESALLPGGTKGVILTLEIPDKDILWSDFNTWHCILNRSSIREEHEWDIYEDSDIDEIKETWERVFDFDYLRNIDKDLYGEFDEEWIQGVTSIIRMDQIKKVTRFIAK